MLERAHWTSVQGRRGTGRVQEAVRCRFGRDASRYFVSFRPLTFFARLSITPVRGHASTITTPGAFSGPGTLDYTYGMEGPYLVTAGSTGLVMGVGWGTCVAEGLGKKEEFHGVVDDSVVLEPVKECEFETRDGLLCTSLLPSALGKPTRYLYVL